MTSAVVKAAAATPPGETPTPLARVRDLGIRHDGATHPAPAAASFDVARGEVVLLLGPSGAGKSTLALALNGLIPHAVPATVEGSVLIDGVDTAVTPVAELSTHVGMVFQDPEHQLLARTVREELEVGPRALGLPEAETTARVDDLLDRLRLSALARANPYTLSGGEKRRLTVAAALATAPRVLVLDEPTFGQDARTWSELVGLLARLRDEGSAIVAITHDEAVVEALHARRFVLAAAPGAGAAEGAA